MRAILATAMFAGFALPLAAAPVPKLLKKSNAALIVGVWTLKSDDPVGAGLNATAEFTEGGKLIVRANVGPNQPPVILEGSYKIDGDKLETSIQDTTHTLTFDALTADELVILDAAGKNQRFTRVVEK